MFLFWYMYLEVKFSQVWRQEQKNFVFVNDIIDVCWLWKMYWLSNFFFYIRICVHERPLQAYDISLFQFSSVPIWHYQYSIWEQCTNNTLHITQITRNTYTYCTNNVPSPFFFWSLKWHLIDAKSWETNVDYCLKL